MTLRSKERRSVREIEAGCQHLEKPGGPHLFLCFVFKRSVMVIEAELKHQLLGVAVGFKEEIRSSRRERTGGGPEFGSQSGVLSVLSWPISFEQFLLNSLISFSYL